MPLILPEHLVDAWIDPDADPQELVKEAVTDVVAEKARSVSGMLRKRLSSRQSQRIPIRSESLIPMKRI